MSAEDRAKWDARYAAGSHSLEAPSPFLEAIADRLPRRGRALDVAGGAGRNALFLARRGLEVTICDVSEVGLSLARERGAREDLPIATLTCDLGEEPLPTGPWDLVISFLFLERRLFGTFGEILAPGGLLVFLQPTVDNLRLHARPPRPFLLERGEIARVAPELEVIELFEGWTDGHYEARLVAQKR